jgi:DNA-binding transcriptional LysR family regulator
VKFWDDAEKSLLRGDVDLFIGGFSRDVNDSRYHWEAFYKDRVITLARRDHPLMKQSTVSISESPRVCRRPLFLSC